MGRAKPTQLIDPELSAGLEQLCSLAYSEASDSNSVEAFDELEALLVSLLAAVIIRPRDGHEPVESADYLRHNASRICAEGNRCQPDHYGR